MIFARNILSFLTLFLVGVIIVLTSGCAPGTGSTHYLQTELEKISYENGISVTEAKIIGDAYLYRYAKDGNKVPHVRIHSGKDDKKNKWIGDIYSGVAISPVAASVPPLEIDKLTGQVTWLHGPTVMRVDLTPANS